MQQLSVSAVLLLLCGSFLSTAGLDDSGHNTFDWTKVSETIKDVIQKFRKYHSYYKFFRLAWDMFSGECQFTCPQDGEMPFPRPGYKPSTNRCGSHVFGFPIDMKIPMITNCCDQHDLCYDTCGQKKRDCDEQFQGCLNSICRNLLIFGGERVHECESVVSLASDVVMYLGCKPYLASQRAACVCVSEEKTEL